MPQIRFFSEGITFKLAHPRKTSSWIKTVIEREKHTLEDLNYIFCSDEALLQINIDYLNHDTFTDIVTFDNSAEEDIIEGDIFISIPRVRENSTKFKTSFQEELNRVMVHGVLHLCGYKDKTAEQKKLMRKKEDTYLSLSPVPRGTRN
jgi:probable rRNA maturation factor